MKVGMIIWSYWPGPEGGAERQCRKVVHQLAKNEIDSVILTSLSDYKLKRKSMDGTVVVRRYGLLCPCSEFLRRFLYQLTRFTGAKHEKILRSLTFWLVLPVEWLARLSFILEVLLTLPGNKFDLEILHVHETAWLAGVGSLLSKRWKIPVVCKVRNTPALEVIGYDTPFRMVWARLRNDVAFIALHRELKMELLLAKISEEKVTIIPNGVELPDLAYRKPISGEVVYVGNFSQGASHKGFDTLLLAWSKVIKEMPGAHLTLVGGGDYGIWKKLAGDLDCSHAITFTGSVKDPLHYYCQAEAFVLPSRHEGMSNALLEAQSWGIACVVSDIPANAAVVSNGANGLTFPVDDHTAMALNIINILSDSDLCSVLGKNARRKAEEIYDLERIAEKLETVYNLSILEGNRTL